MIISQTPHRISFFGGGTDYPSYYLKHGGKVLGTAIDKYCYLNIRKLPPFFEHKHRIVYSNQENVNHLGDIQHPSVRETLKYLNVDYGVSIHHDGDIPARSGMGSSSSFTTGLLRSLLALDGKHISKEDLTFKTLHIEQELIKENVGSQDQVFAAHGGFNLIEFHPGGELSVKPVILPAARLNNFKSHLMLFFTGFSRIASDIAKEQIKNTELNLKNLDSMKNMVNTALNILTSEQPLEYFGELLHETWQLKKTLSNKITNDQIEHMYLKARNAGAIGGKLLGAGGGGFMLLFVDPEKQEQVKTAMNNYLHVPFNFDFDGSKIIVYKPNN
jgi:D-glycero-alpha-D-manno-heptose-7-phosphate kinase